MPSIASAPVSPLSSRKRRRDDHSSIEIHAKLSPHSFPCHGPLIESTTTHFHSHSNEIRREDVEKRPMLPKPRRMHDSKRQRVERVLHPSPSPAECGIHDPFFSHNHNEMSIHTLEAKPRNIHAHESIRGSHETIHVQVQVHVKKPIDLSPCHICHRKPTVRSELDAFADCEGCGKRACYICIRECLGSAVAVEKDTEMRDFDGVVAASLHADEVRNGDGDCNERGHDPGREFLVDGGGGIWNKEKVIGHRGMVCSKCCVERGTEGEVWCLGCLRVEEGG